MTTANVTPETLAELRRLLDAASPRPWLIRTGPQAAADAALIVALVLAAPALLDAAAEVEALRASLATSEANGTEALAACFAINQRAQDAEAERDALGAQLAGLRAAAEAVLDSARRVLDADDALENIDSDEDGWERATVEHDAAHEMSAGDEGRLRAALTDTAQAAAEHDARVRREAIEEAAMVCDGYGETADELAARIRTLATKPKGGGA